MRMVVLNNTVVQYKFSWKIHKVKENATGAIASFAEADCAVIQFKVAIVYKEVATVSMISLDTEAATRWGFALIPW